MNGIAVALQVLRRDQHIIHVDKDFRSADMVLIFHLLEEVVHHSLERCGGVRKTEKHDIRLKKAELGLERSFVSVFPLDEYAVKPGAYVELRVDARALFL